MNSLWNLGAQIFFSYFPQIAQTWISRAVNYFKDRVLGQKHDVQLLHMDGSTVVVDILIRYEALLCIQ